LRHDSWHPDWVAFLSFDGGFGKDFRLSRRREGGCIILYFNGHRYAHAAAADRFFTRC
jgi:hypothetical protein